MTEPAGSSDSVAVRARGLAKTFRGGLGRPGVAAVADATFDVRRGEVLALLGPNGAGKTTTLKMLVGLVFPTDGSAELFGMPLAVAVARGLVGYLPDRPALYQHLSPEGVLSLAAALAGVPAAQRRARIDALLARLTLGSVRRRAVRHLSQGTQQRLALAQALVGEPPLLVLDEPMSGLDPLGQRELRAVLGELRSSGTTIVLSTHLLADVEATCDRVAIMVAGRVRRVDSPRAFAEPLEAVLVREAAAAADEARP